MFSHEVEATALRRYTIAQHLESALHNNQLTKHYQPLYTVDGSHIVGFEALARWHDAELGNLSPAEFVPVAEQNARLSRMLTEWSLTTVCGEVPKWPFRPGDAPLRIAVNVPPDQFYEPGFVDRVLGTLEEHHLAHDSRSANLVDGVIRIAHGFGLKVVAEGVEHEAQRALLQEFGCDVVQGGTCSVAPFACTPPTKNPDFPAIGLGRHEEHRAAPKATRGRKSVFPRFNGASRKNP